MGEEMNVELWHVCVLVPARNEETLLPRCLKSILAACDILPNYCTADIIVTVDLSTDRTFKIAEDYLQGKGKVVEITKANVGCARQYAAKIALSRYQGLLTQCWLANTDADCEVPATWLVDQITLANTGVQGIAGIVKIDSFLEHDINVPERFKDSYTLHLDGTHPHVHGANLGIRADVYQEAGGWGELETAEDHDLWNRLSLYNISKVSDSRLWVSTSGRRVGRAPRGFADKLASYNGMTNAQT